MNQKNVNVHKKKKVACSCTKHNLLYTHYVEGTQFSNYMCDQGSAGRQKLGASSSETSGG